MNYKKLWLKYLSEVRRLRYAIVPTLTHFSEIINADYEEVSKELDAVFVYQTQHDIILEGVTLGKYKADVFRMTGQKVRDDGKLSDLIEGLREDDGFLQALNDTAAADWGEDAQEQEPQPTPQEEPTPSQEEEPQPQEEEPQVSQETVISTYRYIDRQ